MGGLLSITHAYASSFGCGETRFIFKCLLWARQWDKFASNGDSDAQAHALNATGMLIWFQFHAIVNMTQRQHNKDMKAGQLIALDGKHIPRVAVDHYSLL